MALDGTLLKIRELIIPELKKGNPVGSSIDLFMDRGTYYDACRDHPELKKEIAKARAFALHKYCEKLRESAPGVIFLTSRLFAESLGKHREDDIMLNLPDELQAQLLDEARDGQLKMSYLTTAYLANNITQYQFEKSLLAIKLAHPDIRIDDSDRMFNIKVELPDNGRRPDRTAK